MLKGQLPVTQRGVGFGQAAVGIGAGVLSAAPELQLVQESEGKKEAAQPVAAATPIKAPEVPTVAPAKRVGEEPAVSPKATTAPPAVEDGPDTDDAAELDAPEAEAPAETGELDLARLFVASSEKKGTTLRITADHQQFFTNLGFLLGKGASAPDIIHNILTRFRADHEAQIQKAMKKQMRHLMAPRK